MILQLLTMYKTQKHYAVHTELYKAVREIFHKRAACIKEEADTLQILAIYLRGLI